MWFPRCPWTLRSPKWGWAFALRSWWVLWGFQLTLGLTGSLEKCWRPQFSRQPPDDEGMFSFSLSVCLLFCCSIRVVLWNSFLYLEAIGLKKIFLGAPGWLSRVSVWLRLRSWSHGPWVRAPRRALCWRLRAWSLFQILCLPLSAPPLFMLCLSLSQK